MDKLPIYSLCINLVWICRVTILLVCWQDLIHTTNTCPPKIHEIISKWQCCCTISKKKLELCNWKSGLFKKSFEFHLLWSDSFFDIGNLNGEIYTCCLMYMFTYKTTDIVLYINFMTRMSHYHLGYFYFKSSSKS
jgi:hypothetical protein